MSYQIIVNSKSIPESVNTLGAGVYLLDFDEEGFYVGFSSDIGKRVKQHMKGLLSCKHSNDLLQMAWIRQHSFTVSLLEATAVSRYGFEMIEPDWMMTLEPSLNRPRDIQTSLSRGLEASIRNLFFPDYEKANLAKRFLLGSRTSRHKFSSLHRVSRQKVQNYLASEGGNKEIDAVLLSLK